MFRSVYASVFAGTVLATTCLGAAAQASTTKPFTLYPAFRGDRGAIEAATDKGLIVELIVRCEQGSGILTYSKVEDLYCGPKHRCTSSRKRAIERLCR
jgi:hypothetical protein